MKSHLATLTATALIGLGVFEPDAAEIRVERSFGPETKMVPKLVAVPKGQKINAVDSNRITMMLQPGHPDADESGMVRYFREEMPTGRYKHPTSIDQLANGDLYLVYYGGEGEYADGTAVYGSRLVKGREKWSPPEQIAEHPFQSLGNGVIWQAPNGWVWLLYVVRYGDTWSSSRIAAKISKDGATTWSVSFMVTFDEGTMVRSHPIVLHDGAYLIPIYHETGEDTELVGPDTASLFLRFDPVRMRWSRSEKIHSRLGNLQPSVVELEDNHLIAYCRRGGGYEAREDAYLVRSESKDDGKTWSKGEETSLPNPNSAIDFIKLRNGHLLLVYNDSKTERSPLTVAISTDNGKTFAHRRNIAEGPNSFAYPTAIQTSDDLIHITFTSDERTVVRRAVFPESAILSPGAP